MGSWQTDLFYDQAGHVISEDRGVIATPLVSTHYRDNVWGADGNLVFVEDQNGTPARLYAQQDGQGNTLSVLQKDGSGDYVVRERYVYDPTGNVQVLKPNGSIWTFAFDNAHTADRDLGDYFVTPLADTKGETQTGNVLGGTQVAWRHFWHGRAYERVAGPYLSDVGHSLPSMRWENGIMGITSCKLRRSQTFRHCSEKGSTDGSFDKKFVWRLVASIQ